MIDHVTEPTWPFGRHVVYRHTLLAKIHFIENRRYSARVHLYTPGFDKLTGQKGRQVMRLGKEFWQCYPREPSVEEDADFAPFFLSQSLPTTLQLVELVLLLHLVPVLPLQHSLTATAFSLLVRRQVGSWLFAFERGAPPSQSEPRLALRRTLPPGPVTVARATPIAPERSPLPTPIGSM